jgi:hypothetical protein
MLDVMRRLLAPVVSCAIGALALFSAPQEAKAQVANYQPVSVPGCNATSLAQIPGTTDMFVGRELVNTTSDGCSGSTWGLWVFRFDWQTQTFATVKPLLVPFNAGFGGIPLNNQKGFLNTAYDATVADVGGELWVAFECSGTGSAFPTNTVSSCAAPMSRGDYTIDLNRLTVVIAGVPDSATATGYSASVPKIFTYQGVPYLYWTAVEFRKANSGDAATRIATRGVQLTRNSNGLLWVANTQSSFPANLGDEVYGSSADGQVGDLADGFDVKVIDGRLLLTSGAGATGCVSPLSPLFGCYRLQIRTAATPLGNHIYNGAVVNNVQLPFNPQEYGRFAQDPSGNWHIFGAFLTPSTTGSATPSNVVANGMGHFPVIPSTFQFGTQDAAPSPNPTSGPRTLDVPWGSLQAINIACRSDAPRPGTDGNSCASATTRFCTSQGYAGGGLMPEYGVTAQALCFRGEHVISAIVPISDLTARNSACNASRLFSDSCASAISNQCVAMGYAGGGFGPTEYAGAYVQMSCLDASAGALVNTTFTNLNQYNNCSASGWTESGSCISAANRMCLNQGYAGGFAITDHAGDGAIIGCAKANVPR